VNELIALFVFLQRAVQGGERERGKKMWRRGRRGLLTSVVTSRFRYSIQTRIGEFIGSRIPLLQVRWKLEAASKARIAGLGARRRGGRVVICEKDR
jgi:IS5 family transposase